MSAIKQLDAAICFPAMLPIERPQAGCNPLDTGRRRESILATIDTQMRSRHDQLVDVMRLKVLEQLRHEVIDAMPAQVMRLDQLFVIRQATKIDTHFDAGIE